MTHGHLLSGSEAIPYHVGHGEGAVRMTRRAGTVAVDIETEGLGADSYNVHSVQIGTPNDAYVLSPEFDRAAIIDAIDAADRLIFHNSPYDVPILVALGFMKQSAVAKVWDTLVASRMAAPSEIGGHDLGTAYKTHLPDTPAGDKAALHKKWREATGKSKAEMFKKVGINSAKFQQYAANDVIMTARLAEVLPAAMALHTSTHPFPTSGDAAYLLEREQTINRMMLARTCTGIEVSRRVVDELTDELMQVKVRADRTLEHYGVPIDFLSAPKVKEAVMDRLDALGEIPSSYPRLMSGRPTADARFRVLLPHPMIEALEARSKALRFTTEYAQKVLHLSERDNRIHPQVAVATAITGRMSMKDPPLQQYPESVRRMMRFDTNAVSMDWSSIEPALFANLAGEAALIEAYEGGGDLYEPIAREAGVPRKIAKVILLAQFYGQGRKSLAWRLDMEEEDAGKLIDRVMGPWKAINRARYAIRGIGDKFGLAQTLSGRVCPIQGNPKTANQHSFGYKAVNYVVQGGAYDLLAEALYEMHRCGLDDALYLAVHDELVVAADAADEVEKIMRTPPPALVEQSGRTPVLRVGRVPLGRYWMPKKES